MKHFLSSLAILGILSGCGGADVPPIGSVSGIVTIDGKPAPNIRVMFHPKEKGRPSNGLTDQDGSYTLSYSPNAMGALIGKHEVSISAPEPSVDDAGSVSKTRLVSTAIPQKYASMVKEMEVKAGSNTIDLTYP